MATGVVYCSARVSAIHVFVWIYAWAGTRWEQVQYQESDSYNTTIGSATAITPRCSGTVEYFAAMQYYAVYVPAGGGWITGYSPTYTSYARWIGC